MMENAWHSFHSISFHSITTTLHVTCSFSLIPSQIPSTANSKVKDNNNTKITFNIHCVCVVSTNWSCSLHSLFVCLYGMRAIVHSKCNLTIAKTYMTFDWLCEMQCKLSEMKWKEILLNAIHCAVSNRAIVRRLVSVEITAMLTVAVVTTKAEKKLI